MVVRAVFIQSGVSPFLIFLRSFLSLSSWVLKSV